MQVPRPSPRRWSCTPHPRKLLLRPLRYLLNFLARGSAWWLLPRQSVMRSAAIGRSAVFVTFFGDTRIWCRGMSTSCWSRGILSTDWNTLNWNGSSSRRVGACSPANRERLSFFSTAWLHKKHRLPGWGVGRVWTRGEPCSVWPLFAGPAQSRGERSAPRAALGLSATGLARAALGRWPVVWLPILSHLLRLRRGGHSRPRTLHWTFSRGETARALHAFASGRG